MALTAPVQHWGDGFFNGYSGNAKRAIFFARYEAISFRGSEITLEHLLPGVLRELAAALLGHDRLQEVARAIEASQMNPRSTPRVSVHAGIPLSAQCKRALAEATLEARAAGSLTVAGSEVLVQLTRS